MILSINQPYFFPNIGYFSLLFHSKIHVFLDEVNMKKKSWITRNTFSTGSSIISIPVDKLSQNKAINEHFIKHKIEVKETFLKKFIALNENANYLHEAINLAISAFESKCGPLNISELNQKGIVELSERLGLNVKFKLQSEISNVSGNKEDLLINICKRLGHKKYLNLEGGSLLYDKDYFLKNDISLYFMNNNKMKNILGHEFNISILSLFAKYGPNKLFEILNESSNFN
jgi:hypothetical protein